MDQTQYLMAKTQPEDQSKWLPLTYHLRDTAGVMRYLAGEWAPHALYQAAGLSRGAFIKIAVFLALVHDLGKATPVFQRKIIGLFPETEAALAKAGLHIPPSFLHGKESPHAKAGAELLRDAGCPEDVAAVVGAHHGKPEGLSPLPLDNFEERPENYVGREGQQAWRNAQRALTEQALAQAGYASMDDLPALSIRAQMLLTGLVVMADWIASNTAFFPLIPADEAPKAYDAGRVDRALERLDLPEPWAVANHWAQSGFFYERFRHEKANSVQLAVQQAAAAIEKPGIMILEAPMGFGKTEAALAAAEIWMNRLMLGGLGFFLPSQATSNAMFSRLRAWAERQSDAERLTIQLAHAMSAMNDEFAALSQGRAVTEEDAQPDSQHLTVHSFFQGRKTNLLANIVTGTVDQLLMAGLMRKFVMLRHLGLAGKVVIIDECHAYDAYMNRYLDRVLGWLGAYGAPVILLSATLPSKRRADLLAAYLNKRDLKDNAIANSEEYPLLSWTDGGKAHMRPIAYDEASRTVLLQRAQEEAVPGEIAAAVASGGCVGVIVNTVRRAQDMARLVQNALPQAVILVDHATFLAPDRVARENEILRRVGKESTPTDRKGVVVIGSQVLEQSLDLDFDLLITDLCPMDLLMQRLGRLHRHARSRPSPLSAARCLVLHADGQALEGGASAVYGDYLLLRTCALLPESVVLPRDISPLVQKTYDEALFTPPQDAAYDKARDAYVLKNQDLRRYASGYCLPDPGEDALQPTIVGMLDQEMGMTDPQAQAAVRWGDDTIDVLMLRMRDNGRAELLSGPRKGTCVPMDRVPDAATAREIARQRVRLPGRFARHWRVEQTLDELQAATDLYLREWRHAPLLHGELFLLLDENNEAALCGVLLKYDERMGLICGEG